MKEVRRSALVPFSREQMFRLVDDVPAYPEFLPWCVAAREECREGAVVVARLELERARVRQGFTTRNTLRPPERIDLELVDGPFATFRGRWEFRALDVHGCKVSLELAFEFAGRVGRLAGAALLTDAADRLVDAFCARARTLYGGAP